MIVRSCIGRLDDVNDNGISSPRKLIIFVMNSSAVACVVISYENCNQSPPPLECMTIDRSDGFQLLGPCSPINQNKRE